MKNARFPIEEFKETQRLNPYWSSWICFCQTIWKRNGLSKKTIRKYFDTLVEGDEYDKNDRKNLLIQLYALSDGQSL